MNLSNHQLERLLYPGPHFDNHELRERVEKVLLGEGNRKQLLEEIDYFLNFKHEKCRR